MEILATGDKSGYGCSFEIKDTTRNVTCCYIHQERELKRGKRLCEGQGPKQPKECRQPESEEYRVEEIDGHPVGSCKLVIPEAKQSDAGVYKVIFPFDPSYNQEITVRISQGTEGQDRVYSYSHV